MKMRSTLLLLLLAGGIFAYIFFVEKKQPTTREKSAKDQLLAKFEPDKITGLDITNGDTSIQLRKSNTGWKLIRPVEDRADAAVVFTLVNAAASVQKSNVLSDLGDDKKRREAFKTYGVQKGKVRLKLLGEGAPPEMHFGKDTAFENKIYARLDSEKDVSVINNELRNLVSKSVEDFRDRKLTPLESSSVNSLQIKSKAGEINLSQINEQWNINTPIKARAASGQVLDLISKGNNGRIEEFITQDEQNLAKFGLAEPVGTLVFGGKQQDEKVEVQIGGPKEKDPAKLYVRVPGRASIYVVGKEIADVLNARPNDLRDKNLARINRDIIDRLTLQTPGKPQTVLASSEEKWKFVEPASKKGTFANELEVNRLMDILTNTEAKEFVSDTASDLAKYGLDQPVLTLRLSSFASENTAESGKGETPVATVLFGRTEGEKLYARLEQEPFIVAVGPDILNNLPTTAAAFNPLEIVAFDPKTVSEVTFQSPGGKPLTVRREGEKWTATGGPLPSNMETLVARLATLRAVKWAPPIAGETGLKNPQTVQFKSGDTTRKLLLGSPTPDGSAYAKMDGTDEIFTLTTDTVQALTPAVAVSEPSPVAPPTSPSPNPPSNATGSQ